MERNAYILINGNEIVIPERLTFSQIIKLEKSGFDVDTIESRPFEALCLIYGVITNSNREKCEKDLDNYFEEGGDFQEIFEKVLKPYTSFFTKTTKKKVGK